MPKDDKEKVPASSTSGRVHEILMGQFPEKTHWERDWEVTGFEPGEWAAVGLEEWETVGEVDQPFALDNPKLTGNVKFFARDDYMYGCAELCFPGTDTCIYLMVKTPLDPLLELADKALYEEAVAMGWSPWKWAKKAGKSISKQVKKMAKGSTWKKITNIVKHPAFQQIAKAAYAPVSKYAMQALQNPMVQQFAMQAAPMALSAFGVPPNITMAATGMINQAMQGNQTAYGKIANINNLSQQGYPPAQRMHGTMKMLYRGGMNQMGSYYQQAQAAAQSYFPSYTQQMPQRIQQYAQQRMPQAYQQTQNWAARYLPQAPYVPGMPPGMFPFQFPRPGGARMSGWLYNVPYRSPLQAKALDVFGPLHQRNPLHLVRALYSQGMKP